MVAKKALKQKEVMIQSGKGGSFMPYRIIGNIQYASLCKFMVSLGVLFVFLPLIMLYLFLGSQDGGVFSNDEWLTYTEETKYLLMTKNRLYVAAVDWFPYISISSIIVGGFFFIIGFNKWSELQELEIKEKKVGVENMQGGTKEQIQMKHDRKELQEEDSEKPDISDNRVSPISNKETGAVSSKNNEAQLDEENQPKAPKERLTLKEHRAKFELMLNECASILQNKFYMTHEVRQNVEINGKCYDIIAVSKNDSDCDIIYEVIVDSSRSPRLHRAAIAFLTKSRIEYKNHVGRACKTVLLIVAPENCSQSYERCIKRDYIHLKNSEEMSFMFANVDRLEQLIQIKKDGSIIHEL